MTRKQQFMSDFDSNKDRKTLWVSVSVPECPEPEVINNPRANFESKRAYYDRAYDDNLILKVNPDIRILTWLFA